MGAGLAVHGDRAVGGDGDDDEVGDRLAGGLEVEVGRDTDWRPGRHDGDEPGPDASVAVTLATTAVTPAGTLEVPPPTGRTKSVRAASLDRFGGMTGAVGAPGRDSHGMLLPSPSRRDGSP
jgi:hypothetical protein